MSKVAQIINSNGDKYLILKESVAGILMTRRGDVHLFTTGGRIGLGHVPETAEQLTEMLLGGEDDE